MAIKIIDKDVFYENGIAVGDRTIIIDSANPCDKLENLLEELQKAKKISS